MSYKSTIDSFDVTNNADYQPSGGSTYCNLFAQDVMAEMGTALPSGSANDMADALSGNGFSKWRSVDAMTAQSRALSGISSIGIKKDSPGHVVVIYPHEGANPSSNSDWHQIYISQAGGTCYNDEYISLAWTKAALPNVRFYSWYA